jgi:peptide-methionine (S)-S-oxide reductase
MPTYSPAEDRFTAALAALDAGDVATLERLLRENPSLATERRDSPADGFFARPYLLWFVAEDPVRAGKLPPNIPEVARVILRAAPHSQEELDYALMLVAWSGVASDCGVQIPLLDALIDAGANPDGGPNNALVNGHVAAAAHLVERGAPLTLASALCLGRWDEADRLGEHANPAQKRFALTLNALRGNAEGVRRLLALGVDPSAVSEDLYSHATPLHHAVWSKSLETVKVLVEAGARLDAVDTAHQGTPMGWAKYGGAGYEEIVRYLETR